MENFFENLKNWNNLTKDEKRQISDQTRKLFNMNIDIYDECFEIYVFTESLKTKTVKTKIKPEEITMEKILKASEKVEKLLNVDTKDFINIAKIIRKEVNLGTYVSSYGLGIDTLLLKEEHKQKIRDYLNKNKIEFREEYSQASLVYRFIFSKNKDNIIKIKNLI